MSKKAYRIVNLIVALLVCVFALGHAFAWLATDRKEQNLGFDGSSGQTYFAGGNGTSSEPYLIADQYHLYNLAWLQDTGKLDEKKYYFELTKDITVPADLWLPPIGTDSHPFKSDFNGNGFKITNLQVTTDKTKLANSSDVEFSNAVGMFGMTGNGAAIHNFILQKPTVEVANANTYSASGSKAAGIAIGHVAQGCEAYSIGVLADTASTADTTGTEAKLLMNRVGYSTFNSIIGELARNVESSVTGGGHLTGLGNGNESLLVPIDIYNMAVTDNKLNDKYNNIFASLSSGDLAFKDYTWLVPSTASPDFRLGGLSLTVKQNVQIRKQDYGSFKYYGVVGENNTKASATEITLGSGSTIANEIIGFEGTPLTKFDGSLYIQNSPDNQPYSNIVYEDNSIVTYSSGDNAGNPLIPAGSTKTFNLIQNSVKMRINVDNARILAVAASNGSQARTLQLSKLQGDNSYSEVEKFESGISNAYNEGEPVPSRNLELPARISSGVYDLVGCIFDLSGTDTTKSGKGSYMLQAAGGGIHIFYICVRGVEGGNMGSENGTIDRSKAVSAVDFIYKDVSISKEKNDTADPKYDIGDFIVGSNLYQATGTSIYFDKLDTVLQIVYLRKTGDKTMQVTADVAGKVEATDRSKVDFLP